MTRLLGKAQIAALLCFTTVQMVFAQDSLIVVKAEKGDGIFSLLRKNGLNPSIYYDVFLQLNGDKIAEGNKLVIDEPYQIPYVDPSVGKSREAVKLEKEYPIFGQGYTKVDSLGNALNNAVIYLVSGHGGPDPGAVAMYQGKQIAEDEYAYDVVLRLGQQLMAHGAQVYFIVKDGNDGIRDDFRLDVDYDEVVYQNKTIPLGQLARLRQRTEVINKLYLDNLGKYQRLLVLHVDSRSKSENIDVFFYHHEQSAKGKRLTKNIHQTFVEKYREFQPNRRYTGAFSERSELYLVKHTLPAMTYIEIGNIKNKKDRKRILDPENRQALAKWIFEGILRDYETKDGD